MPLPLHSEPTSDLRFVAHAVRGNFLQQIFLTNDLTSTLTAWIPLFLCCLPLGPWSSLFHILVLVLPNLGHSFPSVKALSEPTRKIQRSTHTFSCHFQVQTSPLSCCGSSTGEELYKVQQSVPFKCVLHKTDVACCSGLDEAMWLFMETDLWRSL